MKLQELLSYVRRAVDDYGMIDENDRIGVGISGGKDSLSLLMALNALKRFYPKKFDICAVTVDLGFDGFDPGSVEQLCSELNVPYHIIPSDIANTVFNIRKEKNPCSLCSNLRRGALYSALTGLGCNKAALGHNRDDVIETFFLSLFYEGRAQTFQPVTFLDRTGVYAIRPLIYTPESEIRGFIRRNGIVTVKNPCPADGNTKREQIKEFIKVQSEIYDNLNSKLFNAILGLPGWERVSRQNRTRTSTDD